MTIRILPFKPHTYYFTKVNSGYHPMSELRSLLSASILAEEVNTTLVTQIEYFIKGYLSDKGDGYYGVLLGDVLSYAIQGSRDFYFDFKYEKGEITIPCYKGRTGVSKICQQSYPKWKPSPFRQEKLEEVFFGTGVERKSLEELAGLWD